MRTVFLVVAFLLSLAFAADTSDPSKTVSAIVDKLKNTTLAEYNKLFQESQHGKDVTLLHPPTIHPGPTADSETNVTYYLKSFDGNETTVGLGLTDVLVVVSGAPAYRFKVTVNLTTHEAHNGTEGLNDAQYFTGFVTVEEPEKPNLVLYIIIGVITAAALIITAVLVISLNKKKSQPEYQPIDDYAHDKIIENF